MKKTSIILAMVALALGFSSCKQEEDPKYHDADASTFTINTPALQNVAFRTSNDMTNSDSFNLFCSQPDYGYSAICTYGALVSLDPNADIDNWIALENQNPTSAAMEIKTFDLGIAVLQLLGIESEEEFEAQGIYDKQYTCYFKAACEIDGIDGSAVVSHNYTSYNKVMLSYAEMKAAWIYICGYVQTEDGVTNGFLAPSASNQATYDEYWRLYEPEDMIGEKLFVGTFWLTPMEGAEDTSNADSASTFRFFTQLLGWTTEASLGSHQDDFYCLPITDKWEAGYQGSIVVQGLGNWGIHSVTPQPMTVVVDTQQNQIYIKEGKLTVTFVGRSPDFSE